MLRIGKIDHILFLLFGRKKIKIILGQIYKTSDGRKRQLKKVDKIVHTYKEEIILNLFYAVLIIISDILYSVFYCRISGSLRRKSPELNGFDLLPYLSVILGFKNCTDLCFITRYGRYIIRGTVSGRT